MDKDIKLFLEDGTYVCTVGDLLGVFKETYDDAMDRIAFETINYSNGKKDECVEIGGPELNGKKCSECRYFKVCTSKDKES